jgi:hypothetical protein
VARERSHVRRDSDDRHVDPPRHMQRSVRRLGAVGAPCVSIPTGSTRYSRATRATTGAGLALSALTAEVRRPPRLMPPLSNGCELLLPPSLFQRVLVNGGKERGRCTASGGTTMSTCALTRSRSQDKDRADRGAPSRRNTILAAHRSTVSVAVVLVLICDRCRQRAQCRFAK